MYFFQVPFSYSLKIGIVTMLFLFTGCQTLLFAQSGNCHPATPFYSVDLTGFPNGTWTSPFGSRIANCCGTSSPDRCVEFSITLDPTAVAINFQIASGAPPQGALFYQINCGPQIPVGSPICLNGPGPYTMTFCKPGNNGNSYSITSIAGPTGSPDKTVGSGCNTTMSISGVTTSSISWTSIFPGSPGDYDSYLNCTNACDSAIVTAQTGHPAYVDYQVCGTPAAGPCVPPGQFCDTIRVYMSTPLLNTINPNPAAFCANNPAVLLTGVVNGGVAPYTYAWTNGPNGTGAVVGTGLTYTATTIGNYSFIVYDQNYPACPAPITNVTVTSSPVPTVNAGIDQAICGTFLTLNGTITGATGGIWSGGSGIFTPGNTALNADYTPTVAELASGTVILTLTSTGNGACNPVSDQVVLYLSTPIIATISSPSVICFGQTATITANVSGGTAPYTYLWNTGETTSSIANALPGTHSVTITGGSPGFCSAIDSVTLNSNPQILVTTSPNNAIVCSSTATISATASGGSGTLNYLWSNGATTSSTNVNTGTYSITVTDSLGCSANNSVSVTTSSSLAATVNQPPTLCNGETTTLTVTVTGGLGGNSFLWSNGDTTENISVGAGNYCVTVTDAGGCITTACVTLLENPPLIVSISPAPVICNGASTTVNASASGGQSPYTFLWNTGQTTQSLVTTAGTYTVTLTDFSGCQKTDSITVLQASAINIAISSDSVGCFGGNNGSATAIVSGGVPSYFYSWLPYGGSSATASSLVAGSYTLTVTDTIGCSFPATIVVSEPLPLAASVTVQNQVSCYGGADGAAIVNPTGGSPAYSYVWSPVGGTLQNPTNLVAGLYTVTITDIKGCITSVQTTITEPAQLTANIVSTTDVSCNGGSTGSATITAVGGTPAYSYSWAPAGGTDATVSNLVMGTYTVTITDLNTCTVPLTIVINQPPPLTSNITSSNNPICDGENNGSATASPSGGTGPYTFVWNTSPVQTTATATNLIAGTYSVTVTDFNNCTAISPGVTLTSPPPVTVTASASSFVSCDTIITIFASSVGGGSGGYVYLWNTGATTSSINVSTGEYIITVTDVAGCSDSDSVSVLASNSTLTAAIAQPSTICFGTTTAITADVTGGLGSITYLWSTGATTSSIMAGAGNHCVTVTDAGGCIKTTCVTIVQNPKISVVIGIPPAICPGDSTTLTAVGAGGQPAYSYLWNSGETSQFVLKPAGTYSVTISDITGSTCSADTSMTITEVPPINTTMSFTDVSCFGADNGSALVYATGGAPGYSYSWAPSGGTNASATLLASGTYTVTVTDTIGCTQTGNVTITQPASPVAITLSATDNLCFADSAGIATASGNGGTAPYFYFWPANGDTLTTITGLIAGTYSVFMADSIGCSVTSSVTVTEPPEIIITSTTTQINCGGTGSVSLTASGGTGTLTISGDDTLNLVAGTYNYTAMDANGCTASVQAIISASAPALILTATATQISCFGGTGSVALVASGGTGSLLITGDSTANLPADTYNYTVSDSNGCVSTAQAIINTAPAILTVSLTATPITCFGMSDGTATATGNGGTSPFYYAWQNGDTTAITESLAVGSYSVTITDDNGCIATSSSISITEPTEITLNGATIASTCGLNNGSAAVTAVGGTGAYTYAWSPSGGTDALAEDLLANDYTVTVMDSNLCQQQLPLTVVSASFLTASFNATEVCFNNTTQFTDSSFASSGSSIISWEWDFDNLSPIDSSQHPAYLYSAAGSYNVSLTVTSSDGCTSTLIQPVTVHSSPLADFSSTNVCLNSSTLFTDLSTVSGGDSISSWLWDFGDLSASGIIQNPNHTYSVPGTYNATLMITSDFGCIDTTNASAIVYPPPDVQFIVNDSSGCLIHCPQFTDTSDPINGTITNWQWDFGDGSPIGTNLIEEHCYISTGEFNVSLTITTSNGCSAIITQSNLIHVYDAPVAEFDYSPQPSSSLSSEMYFNNLSEGASVWSWNFGDVNDTTGSSLEFPSHNYADVGNYCITLVAQNNYQCIDTVIHCLEIEPEFTFFIPNAFTPSENDGTNDGFTGFGTNINKYEMWIFDRWGNMIFYTDDLKKPWDGKANKGKEIAQRDVYVYLVEIIDFKGNNHQYRGIVTLVR